MNRTIVSRLAANAHVGVDGRFATGSAVASDGRARVVALEVTLVGASSESEEREKEEDRLHSGSAIRR
jgi:hypothetical protein